jgi:hypothetical protein
MNHQDPTHEGEENAAQHLEQHIKDQMHHNTDMKREHENTHRLKNQ